MNSSKIWLINNMALIMVYILIPLFVTAVFANHPYDPQFIQMTADRVKETHDREMETVITPKFHLSQHDILFAHEFENPGSFSLGANEPPSEDGTSNDGQDVVANHADDVQNDVPRQDSESLSSRNEVDHDSTTRNRIYKILDQSEIREINNQAQQDGFDDAEARRIVYEALKDDLARYAAESRHSNHRYEQTSTSSSNAKEMEVRPRTLLPQYIMLNGPQFHDVIPISDYNMQLFGDKQK